jgi:hypothetical protein
LADETLARVLARPRSGAASPTRLCFNHPHGVWKRWDVPAHERLHDYADYVLEAPEADGAALKLHFET